jgi:hypothetical protein
MSTAPRYDRAWLHRFALATRELMLLNARANSCILTTHVGLEVLDRFGIKARPQPVIAEAFNAVAARLRFGVDPPTPLQDWPDEAWSVGISGTGVIAQESQTWDGHLVIVVRNPDRLRTLIDLTADQMDRPAKNINIGGPVFTDLPKVWTPRDPTYTMLTPADPQATVIGYRPLAQAGDWRTSRDWTEDVSPFVDAVIAELA